MKDFKKIREVLSGTQGALAILSAPSLMIALEVINILLRSSDQIHLVGILPEQGDQTTVLMAGEVGFIRHATNALKQESGNEIGQVTHAIIMRPHEQLLDWIERAITMKPLPGKNQGRV